MIGDRPQAAALMDTFRGVARRVVVISSIDVYRASGVLHGTESGQLEPVPLTEDSALRTGPPYPLKFATGQNRGLTQVSREAATGDVR